MLAEEVRQLWWTRISSSFAQHEIHYWISQNTSPGKGVLGMLPGIQDIMLWV